MPRGPRSRKGDPLTAKQQAIFDFIKAFHEKRTYYPTHHEIAVGMGYASDYSVRVHLIALRKKGRLRKAFTGSQRAYIILEKPEDNV